MGGKSMKDVGGAGFAGSSPSKVDTIFDFCVSSFRRGHANLLCIVPILTDDLRRGSNSSLAFVRASRHFLANHIPAAAENVALRASHFSVPRSSGLRVSDPVQFTLNQ